MAYQAIYRKWRPLVFEDIVGQTHITRTLKNQILSGRVAHAYLFCGTRGTGKTTAAKVFARAVNCLNNTDGSPCNECEVCRGILEESIMEVSEIDAASNNSVEDIRALQDELTYSAAQTKYRVYIIDEVHMLSPSAFNALLKTLEEPPEHVIFILATTEAHKIPQTILSRCQRFDFRRIRPSDIILRMREIAAGDGLNITDDAYALLARLAEGSMRDGLSILERCVSACGNYITEEAITDVLGIASRELVFNITDAIITGNTGDAIGVINTLMKDGKSLNSFINDVTAHFRDLLVCKISNDPREVLDCGEENVVRLKTQSGKASFEKISYATEVLSKAQSEARWVKNPRVIYELALVKLTRSELDTSNEALLARISDIEDKVKNGVTVNVTSEKTESKPDAPKKKKPKPSERIFKPMKPEDMFAENPVVAVAKKWDNILKNILKKSPHLSLVRGKDITVDGEGIIILFQSNEMVSKAILDKSLDTLEEMVHTVSGADIRIKTAMRSYIEDYIIDFWSLPSKGVSEEQPETIEDIIENSQKEEVEERLEIDPIDELSERFPEIVELTDESEFINYDLSGEAYEQKSINADGDEEREEFLEESETNIEE